jgi:hypothetical protein
MVCSAAPTLTKFDGVNRDNVGYTNICCSENGTRIFATGAPFAGTVRLSAFSFNGTDIVHVVDTQMYIANWSYSFITCNRNGSRIFITTNGQNAYNNQDGLIVFDFDGTSFTEYSFTLRAYDTIDVADCAYDETDDVVFVAARNNGITAFKNNGTAYELVDEYKCHIGGVYKGIAYNKWDGNVYCSVEMQSKVICYGWNNSNDSLYFKAWSSRTFVVSTYWSDTIAGKYDTIGCPHGNPLVVDKYMGIGVYDGDEWIGGFWRVASNAMSAGICWVGRDDDPNNRYFAVGNRGCTGGHGLILAKSSGGVLSTVDTYNDGNDYCGVSYSDNNFNASSSVNGYLFVATYQGFFVDMGVSVFEVAGINDPPILSNPIPSNRSTGINITLSHWNISIRDPNGDTFNYSIECSNGDSTTDGGASNGTKSLTVSSGLNPSTRYTVWVNATDPGGSAFWINETFWFETTLGTTVTADFTYSPSSPVVNEEVTFRDQSSTVDIIISWLWNFGDGHTGVGKNIDHTFDKEGRFGVTLTVRTLGGSSDHITRYVQVADISYGDPRIFPPIDPLYPSDPYSIPDMYRVLRANDASLYSDSSITIVFIDTGYTPRTYEGVDLSTIIGYGSAYSSVFDSNGHGTWISYALGYIVQTQIPNAKLISYNVFGEDGVCTMEDLLGAFDYVEKLKPDIVSFSGGAYGSPDDVLSKRVDRLRSNGILVVVAAGNLGPSLSTILSPACSEGAVAIGAIDPMKTILERSDDTVTPWSSRGPVSGVFIKPDCTSPGESIVGPWLEGEIVVSGTSMATPLIAGGYAVIYAHNKGLLDIVEFLYFWDRGTVGNILESGVADTIYKKSPVDSYGLGIPDFKEADHAVFISAILHILLMVVIIAVIAVIIIYVVYKWKFSEKKSD